ncbi:complement factor I [Labeo rohita]|uniref:trypsin n=1 Tax=Labeo rohita TaxID=84645 RepID=A0A498LLL2_LABRO|nr:complement factor I [Labeo rohita]
MKVLSVFIFTCLLFQTASLQKKKHAPEEQRTDLNLEQIRDGLHDKKIPVSEENTRDTLLEEISKQVSALEPRPPKLEPDTQAKPDSTPKTPQGPDEHFFVPPEQESKQIESAPDLRPPKLKPDTPAKPDSTPKTPQGPDEHFLVPPEQESKQIESAPDLRPPKLKPDTPAKPDSTPKPKVPDEHFLSPQCLNQNYTWFSCSKVFCPPWRRCIGGQCVCKMPYKCPRQQINACTLDGSVYYSMCQANAISCRTKKPIFSHFSQTCKAEDNVKVTLMDSDAHKVVEIKTSLGKKLVCGKDWNMAAANVVCRNPLEVDRGAEKASKIAYGSLDKTIKWPNECMRVRCMGYELSLAECTIYKPEPIAENAEVAVAKCYEKPKGECKKFVCANGKCLLHGKPCNGIDDCGDNSDEMCCQSCREKGFHCKSGVCIPRYAIRDGIRDCLGGEDELEEIKEIRATAEKELQCGVPNMEYVYKPEVDATSRTRRKRLVGGEEALPTQIQWQVAIQDEGLIHCGGAYLGGCWVLTAAHCVRAKPKSFRVKFSLWRKHRKQSTTDSIPVKNIIIHQDYNPQTYANDIALIRLEELNLSDKCMQDNPAVRAVCVPWSTQQFQPSDNCTISGWGRNREGMSAAILKWANVTIIGDCNNIYKERFLPGMECAGDLEGKVDSCQGDSGGPLVCTDKSGLSYVWGIVSWGDKCGEPNYPGVYTKVAHYFDWIRFHTGWPAVTKYNQ